MGVTCEHTPFLTSHLISSLPTAVLGEIKNVAAVVAKCSCSVFFPVLLGLSYLMQPGGRRGPYNVPLWADWNEP